MILPKLHHLLILLLLISGLTIIPAFVNGKYSNRWTEPADLSDAALRLQGFPRVIGDWELSAEGEVLNERAEHELGLASYLSRDYKNRLTDDVVALLLMVGRPGPLVRHPPTICYANRANTPLGNPLKLFFEQTNPESVFEELRFRRESRQVDPFRVIFSHTADGVWDVPDWPRIVYGNEPALYKVRILFSESASTTSASADEAVRDFVENFVVVFQQFLAGDDASSSEEEPAELATGDDA